MSKGRCGLSHRHVAEVLDVGSSLAGDMGFTDGNGVSEIDVCLQVDDLTMIQGSVLTLTVMIMLEQKVVNVVSSAYQVSNFCRLPSADR